MAGSAILPSLDAILPSSSPDDDEVASLQSHFVNFGQSGQQSCTFRCTQWKQQQPNGRIILKTLPPPVGTAVPVMKVWQSTIDTTASIVGYPKPRRANERDLYGRVIGNTLYSEPFPDSLTELEKNVWAHVADRVNLQLIAQGESLSQFSVSCTGQY